MSRRLGAWWVWGVVVPLVLGGLIVMHTVDLGSVGPTSAGDRASVARAVAPVEMHGEHDHGCDDCHLGLHITAVCAAVLGSIAVWRVAHRLTGNTTHVVAARSTCARPKPPLLLLLRGRPPCVELGVMLC
jgi:hypothetical protein